MTDKDWTNIIMAISILIPLGFTFYRLHKWKQYDKMKLKEIKYIA